jgi:Putative zinc ribbon domain
VNTVISCVSCGMPMETAEDHAPKRPDSTWCRHCSTPEGDLQGFDERFERMMQWNMRQDGLDRTAAEAATRAYMRNMPAWRDHPSLQ